MSFSIREGDVEADGGLIANALNSYLTPLADQARFEWLYKRNPHGKVRVWLALDGDGQIAGTAAAFPRNLYVARQRRSGWVFGDFCVSERYRSLGPAVALQRALLKGVDDAGVLVSYDFPSTAMTAVYKRLKIEAASQMVRLAKMLRVDRKLQEQVRYEALTKVLSPFGNVLLRATSSHARVDRTIEISVLENRCGREFDSLTERVPAKFAVCAQRSSAYLNWRYLDNPYKKHQLMIAKRGGSLLGFVVFSQNGPDGEIVDLFGDDDEAVIGGLIDATVELFRRCGVMTVSVELIASHPWIELFKNFGFYPRESKPFIVYAPQACASATSKNGAFPDQPWFITGGDRDS